MNTWGYLILIAALLLLSAFMLYARFASRSREKSLHHAPQDAAIVEATLVEAIVDDPVFDSYEQEEALVVDFKACPTQSDPDAGREDVDVEKEEEEYFDELQEAAAGLAMLMRSSPVTNRAEPVVFAPEEEEAAEKELVREEEVFASSDGRVEEFPSTAEAMNEVEAILDAPSVFGEEAGPAMAFGNAPLSEDLKEILGEEVTDQFESIDHSLEELQSLVEEMEGELVLFDEFLSAPIEEKTGVAA